MIKAIAALAGIALACALLTPARALDEPCAPRLALRVVAHSDSPRDQAAKADAVRAVLRAYGRRWAACVDEAALRAALYADLEGARREAERAGGMPAAAHVALSAPDGSPCVTFTLTLGDGGGHNWFGLLCAAPLRALPDADQPLVWHFLRILRLFSWIV